MAGNTTPRVSLSLFVANWMGLNISDIDVWMWLKKLSPKSPPVTASLKAPLISLFSELGQWSDLVDP
jgi:hypothetical protein